MPLPSPRRPLAVGLLTALAAGSLSGALPAAAADARGLAAVTSLDISLNQGADGQDGQSLRTALRAAGTPEAFPVGVLMRQDMAAGVDTAKPAARQPEAAPAAPRSPAASARTAPARTAPARTPAPSRLTATPTSLINVTYVNSVDAAGNPAVVWNEPAKAAFEAAVALWERTLESRVPIEITANATALPVGALGSAGPADFLRNENGTVTDEEGTVEAATRTLADDVFEPVALFNAKLGRDATPGVADIVANFDPTQSFLYFGTDGKPGAEQYDFRSIVLHEIGHGLGLVGTGTLVSPTRAEVGVTDVNGNTGVRSPVTYDTYVYSTPAVAAGNGGVRVVDLADGSADLQAALTGNGLYWAGQLARTAAGSKVRLYAPAAFEQGSSFGHLNEDTYPKGSLDSLMSPVLDAGEAYLDPGQVTLGMMADIGYAVPTLTGSRYTALDPIRLLDTRNGTGGPQAPVRAGGVIDLQVAGVASVPENATAVVLNVTGAAPTQSTDIRVYPTPVTQTPVPEVSNLNLQRGVARANLVTVAIGNNGRVRLRNAAGEVGLLADLAGYYAPTGLSVFTPVEPRRVLDTRAAVGTTGKERVVAGGVVELQVAGPGTAVPADATAVAMTVTAVNATAATDVRAYPLSTTAEAPLVSNLNVGRRGAVPNLVIVKVGEGGRVRLRNNAGQVHLLADISGYYDASATGSVFRAIEPARLLDTRSRLGQPVGSARQVGPGQEITLLVGGVARLPQTATAAVLNVTATGASGSTDVRVYPTTAPAVPLASNLNLGRGETTADLVVVKLGAGKVTLRNTAGSVALLADVAGWFGPA